MPSSPRLPVASPVESVRTDRSGGAPRDEYRAIGAAPIIDLRAMHSALAVADELHFTRAAEKLNLTQSALSRQIQQLESALGVELFKRGTRRVELTEAGVVFTQHARKTLAQARAAIMRTQAIGKGEPSEFLITYSPFIDIHLVTGIQTVLESARPRIPIRARSVSPQEQAEMLLRGTCQMGIVILPLNHQDLQTICVFREELLVALPGTHRLARKRQIHAGDLAGEPVVWFARELHPGFLDHTTELFRQAGYAPNLKEEVQSISEALAFVQQGSRVSFVKRSDARLQPTGIVVRPFAEAFLTVETGLAYPRDQQSGFVQEIMELLTRHFHCAEAEPSFSRR